MLLNGVGGIGKTTLALKYIHSTKYKKAYTNIAWISVDISLKEDFVSQLSEVLAINISKIANIDQQINHIIKLLRQQEGDNLLVIDNANSAKDIDHMEDKLNDLPWNVLLTSRENPSNVNPSNVNHLRVQELSAENSKLLFIKWYKHYHPAQEEALNNLLLFINHHTLLSELLAKVGNESDISIPNLLEKLKTNSLEDKDLQEEIKIGLHAKMTDGERNTSIEYYINNLFEPEKLPENTWQFLRLFSLLPNQNIAFKDIEPLFKEIDDLKAKIKLLQKKSWISKTVETTATENRISYRMHSLVQSIIFKRLETEKHTQNYLWHLDSLLKQHLTIAHLFTPYAYSALEKLKQPSRALASMALTLSDRYYELGNYSLAQITIEKSLEIRKQLDDKELLAIVYNRLGNLFLALGKTNKALLYYNLMTEVQKNFTPPIHKVRH